MPNIPEAQQLALALQSPKRNRRSKIRFPELSRRVVLLLQAALQRQLPLLCFLSAKTGPGRLQLRLCRCLPNILMRMIRVRSLREMKDPQERILSHRPRGWLPSENLQEGKFPLRPVRPTSWCKPICREEPLHKLDPKKSETILCPAVFCVFVITFLKRSEPMWCQSS